jgi:hypothetical protein
MLHNITMKDTEAVTSSLPGVDEISKDFQINFLDSEIMLCVLIDIYNESLKSLYIYDNVFHVCMYV